MIGRSKSLDDGNPPEHQYVGYYRVSSRTQSDSGLSIAGQADSVRQFVQERGGKLVAEFTETRSGLKSAGKQLREAIRNCYMRRAILIVSAIDRLSRRTALIAAIMDSDIELVVADSPDADRVVLHVKAAWAEQESMQRSARVRAALAEAKRRGKKLGGPPFKDMRRIAKGAFETWRAQTRERDLLIAPLIWQLRSEGKTHEAIATELNWRNIPSATGRSWHSSSVRRNLIRTKEDFRTLAKKAAAQTPWREINAQRRAERVAPLVWELRLQGLSLVEAADEMNRRGIPTPRGRKWCREKLRRLLLRGRAALPPKLNEELALCVERRRQRMLDWAFRAAPTICGLRYVGLSLQAIVRELDRRKVPTARGGQWHVGEVQTVLDLAEREQLCSAIDAAA